MDGQIVEVGDYVFSMILIVFRVDTCFPLSPGGTHPLAGRLAWEELVEEEVQAGRGVGMDKACVHPS